MPMSDGSHWRLWYRLVGAAGFVLGAPRFLNPDEVPYYTIADARQRRWTFAQPLLAVPEPSGRLLVSIGAAALFAATGSKALLRKN